METTSQFQTESTQDCDLLFLASSVLLEVNQIVKWIHILVAFLLRYAMIGISIADSLMELMVLSPSEES